MHSITFVCTKCLTKYEVTHPSFRPDMDTGKLAVSCPICKAPRPLHTQMPAAQAMRVAMAVVEEQVDKLQCDFGRNSKANGVTRCTNPRIGTLLGVGYCGYHMPVEADI